MTITDRSRQRAAALQLHGVLAHWAACAEQPWLDSLLTWEETERARRSLNAACAARISAVSSRWQISTGLGRNSVTKAPLPS